jgi:hypothetical protein
VRAASDAWERWLLAEALALQAEQQLAGHADAARAGRASHAGAPDYVDGIRLRNPR